MLSADNVRPQAPSEGNRLGFKVIGNDTLNLAFLKYFYVFPDLQFMNSMKEEFYWRTACDVKGLALRKLSC